MKPENNQGYTKPNVVLGYKNGDIPKFNTIGEPEKIIPVRAIGFYNTTGSIGSDKGYNFNNFVKLVNKIWSEYE